MKRINIKNLKLQFDEGVFRGDQYEQATNMLNHVNEVLARYANHDSCPQIMNISLGKSNVEVEDDGEGDLEP
jgi:hypothetical protein